MQETKDLPVPGELVELFDEINALYECRDAAVKNLFGFKRSIRYAKLAVQAHRKAWITIRELYPHLGDGDIKYDHIARTVSKVEE